MRVRGASFRRLRFESCRASEAPYHRSRPYKGLQEYAPKGTPPRALGANKDYIGLHKA